MMTQTTAAKIFSAFRDLFIWISRRALFAMTKAWSYVDDTLVTVPSQTQNWSSIWRARVAQSLKISTSINLFFLSISISINCDLLLVQSSRQIHLLLIINIPCVPRNYEAYTGNLNQWHMNNDIVAMTGEIDFTSHLTAIIYPHVQCMSLLNRDPKNKDSCRPQAHQSFRIHGHLSDDGEKKGTAQWKKRVW